MSTAVFGDSFSKIFPLILALLLIFIIPMLMRKYGLEWDDLIRILMTRFGKQDYSAAARKNADGKKKREPYQSNGRTGDLKSLVSTLLIFARRNKFGLVYPGTVVHKGKMASLLALLVTKEKVYGLNCFGYGGTIRRSDKNWIQHMNGVDQQIPDPLKGNQEQYRILRAVMDENGMREIPLEIKAVFTSRSVVLAIPPQKELFDVEGLLTYLKEETAVERAVLDPSQTARKLNEHVERVRPQRKS